MCHYLLKKGQYLLMYAIFGFKRKPVLCKAKRQIHQHVVFEMRIKIGYYAKIFAEIISLWGYSKVTVRTQQMSLRLQNK